MKFILVSRFGEGLHVLWQLYCEGNDVEAYITTKGKDGLWNGLLPHVDKLNYDKDATYIFDMSGNGKIADELRSKGHYVVGGSKLADDIEFDRELGLSFMEQAGIVVPESKEFKDVKEAQRYIAGHKETRFVIKPSGKNLSCSLTHVPKEGEDIETYIEYVDSVFGKDIESYEIQEFIEGVSVSTEGWFDGEHFVEPYNYTLERKKFMNCELGPATGCVGNIVCACYDKKMLEFFSKLEPLLKGKHVGPIDLNRIFCSNGNRYGLEWTPRFGYDSMPAFLPLLEMETSKFFADIARGQLTEIKMSDDYSGALRVAIPPYPEDKEDMPGGLPLCDISSESNKYYFYEIALKDNRLVHSKGYGLLLCTLAQGDFIEDVMCECQDLADDLSVPNKMYRTDLAEVIQNDSDDLEEALDA